MADNRKYYYLKLKENFFDSDSVNPLPKRNGNAPQGLKIRHFCRRGQMADICPTFVHQR